MNFSKLIAVLLFEISLISSSMQFHPDENHPCPGVFEKLQELVADGDDPDAIARLMEGCPRGFSKESAQILNDMIQHDRLWSFQYLFDLSLINNQVNVPDFLQDWFRDYYKYQFFGKPSSCIVLNSASTCSPLFFPISGRKVTFTGFGV
jgi:hypothetical protein